MSTPQILLHIGMNKTGTSSIQATFSDYDDGRTRYAQLGLQNHTGPFHLIFGDEERWRQRLSSGAKPRRLLQLRQDALGKLKDELALGRKTIIVSGEGIAYLRQSEIKRMRRFFHKHGYRTLVFAYIREPAGFSASVFQQRVKGRLDRFSIDRCQPAYRERFTKFLNVFGRQDVRLSNFRRNYLKDQSVVQDFAQQAGALVGKHDEKTINESASAAAVAHLYFWNKHRAASIQTQGLHRVARIRLAGVLSGLMPGKFNLSKSVARMNADHNDIAWMETVGRLDLRFALQDDSEDDADAVDCEQDLHDLRERTFPVLKGFAASRADVPSSAETSQGVMDLLFKAYLGEAKRESRQPGALVV